MERQSRLTSGSELAQNPTMRVSRGRLLLPLAVRWLLLSLATAGAAHAVPRPLEFVGYAQEPFRGGVDGAVVSPDGANVYVLTGFSSSGAVAVFGRDPATGLLSFIETDSVRA